MIRFFTRRRVGKAERAHPSRTRCTLQVGTALRAFANPTLVAFIALATPAAAQTAPPSLRQHVSIAYVEIEGDPRYEPIRAYERLVLKTRDHPFTGAQIGIDEAAALV